jgi:hypothetical protein
MNMNRIGDMDNAVVNYTLGTFALDSKPDSEVRGCITGWESIYADLSAAVTPYSRHVLTLTQMWVIFCYQTTGQTIQ